VSRKVYNTTQGQESWQSQSPFHCGQRVTVKEKKKKAVFVWRLRFVSRDSAQPSDPLLNNTLPCACSHHHHTTLSPQLTSQPLMSFAYARLRNV